MSAQVKQKVKYRILSLEEQAVVSGVNAILLGTACGIRQLTLVRML
jgi:hypothetical protein